MRSVKTLLLLLALVSLALASCSRARYVLVEPTGGVVAMPSQWNWYREKATQLMAQKCPNGYEIVREEEVPVGTEARGEDTTEVDRLFGEATTSHSYSTHVKTEYRIRFLCK